MDARSALARGGDSLPDSPRAKALVAMSGGVDSAVAAALMRDEGFECVGVTLILCGQNGAGLEASGDVNDARLTAARLGMAHYTLDLAGAFREEVIRRFVDAYEQGLTPNPCVECNRFIKFGLLFQEVGRRGCGLLATGHYARIEKSGSRYLLKKAADPKKDQSYVLYRLGQETLARVRFPLGNLTKKEAKELALARGLAGAGKRESQDICFAPDGDYGAFMEAFTGRRYPPGDILDMAGNTIGRHRGQARYTLGQRRGLGVAANEPVYVVAKDAARNTVTLGPERALYGKVLVADRINLIACENLEKPMRVKAKTRYLQQEQPAWAVQTGPDEIRVEFDEGQRAITPGQSAVLYDGDIAIGGGTIAASF